MKYKADLHIITHATTDNNGKETSSAERIDIPLDSFEVDGGANRKIKLSSSDDISISSELEQARSFKNIIFYIPPTKDFLALKLIDIGRNFQFFSTTLVVSSYLKGVNAQTL